MKKKKERKLYPDNPTEQPPKKGLMRVFELIDRDGGKFFKAGILALLGLLPLYLAALIAVANASPVLLLLCIPTGMLAAPQIVAAADTVMRSMRDEVGWWFWDTYKSVWKRSRSASMLPGAIGGLLVGLQLYCVYFLTTLENPAAEFYMLLAAMAIGLGVLQFYLPMMVCVELPFAALFRNCFVLFLCHPIKSILASLVQLIYWGIMLIWFPLTLVILAITSVWLPMLLSYSILYRSLDQHMDLTESYRQLQKQQWGGEE